MEELDARRRAVVDRRWTWLRQVHGARVVTVGRPGDHAGADADAAVTAASGTALSVVTADCAPVVLAGDGAVGVAHAGWRGMAAGVVEATVEALRRAGATGGLRAVLGPCIRACCYEFGAPDLDQLAARAGDGIRGVTRTGRPALDLPAWVAGTLAAAGVADLVDLGDCTACEADRWFSHRARRESARQATVAWLEEP